MANSLLESFVNTKNAESKYLTLKAGESARIFKVQAIKRVTKAGFSGEEKEVLRLIVLVDIGEGAVIEKNFDNATARFVQTLIDQGIDVGSSFTMTRQGEKEKTRYLLSDVTNANRSVTPGQTAIPSTPVAPKPAAPVAAPVAPNPLK